MNMTKLSVSSVILAGVLSGCSQQQMIGGSQLVNDASKPKIEGSEPIVVAVTKPRPAAKPAPVRVYNKPLNIKRVAKKPVMTRSIQRASNSPATKPGQCFDKVKVAPNYVTKSKRVLIQKASSKRVLVRAPQYRWISKKMLVRKAQYVNRTIPAVYQNQTTRVLVKPAHHTWKEGKGKVTHIDSKTGLVMHRVSVPATYRNVTKRVIVRSVQNIRTFIPATYNTVKQKKRVSAALYKTVKSPARYQTKNYRVKVAGARYTWRPTQCATKSSKAMSKAAMMNKSAKLVQKQKYNRSATSADGVSYSQFIAVMNTPLKVKAAKKKSVKKKIEKKMVMPKKAAPEVMSPKKPAPEVMSPKGEMAPKMTPKTEIMVPKAAVMEPKSAVMKPKAAAPKKADNKTKNKAEIQENIVYGIQAALKSKGYNPGKLDGKMGKNTAKALKAFQSSRGLPVGVLSKDTFRALGLVK